MNITSAEFIISNQSYDKCPAPTLPEFAFIGRSNVGKSSLINMLCGRNELARTSQTPGKTQLINHFLINKNWYLVDLPGYGFAKVSKSDREKFQDMIEHYISRRTNLINTFVLIDVRHPMQKGDAEFMEWMGENGFPFTIVFTKADKLGKVALATNVANYEKQLLEKWEEIPKYIVTSAVEKKGRDEVLQYIEENQKFFKSK